MQIDNLYLSRKIVEILDIKCNETGRDKKDNWNGWCNGKGEDVGADIQKLINESKQFIKNSKMETLEIRIGNENCLLAEIPYKNAIKIQQLGKNGIRFWLSKNAVFSESENHVYDEYKHLKLINRLHLITATELLALGINKDCFDAQIEKSEWSVTFKNSLIFKIIDK